MVMNIDISGERFGKLGLVSWNGLQYSSVTMISRLTFTKLPGDNRDVIKNVFYDCRRI